MVDFFGQPIPGSSERKLIERLSIPDGANKDSLVFNRDGTALLLSTNEMVSLYELSSKDRGIKVDHIGTYQIPAGLKAPENMGFHRQEFYLDFGDGHIHMIERFTPDGAKIRGFFVASEVTQPQSRTLSVVKGRKDELAAMRTVDYGVAA